MGSNESCTFICIGSVVNKLRFEQYFEKHDVEIEIYVGVRHEDFVINKVKSP